MKYLILISLLVVFGCDKAKDALDDVNPIDQFVAKDDNSDDEDPADPVTDDTPTEELDAVTVEYMELINGYRHDLGLEKLTFSKVIQESAFGHSTNMATKVVAFSHTGSSARCSSIQKSLGGGNLCGEIIAMGQKTALAAFNAWKNSSGHNSIMTNSRYTHTGLGYAKDASGTYYWTQIFLEME